MFASSDVSVAWLLGGEGLPGSIDPDQEALVWEGGRLTYSALKSSALSLAAAFAARGLEPGDVVLCHLHNRGEILQVYFACAYAGMTLVPASFRLTAPELARIVAESRARLIFTEDALVATARQALAEPDGDIHLVVLGENKPGEEFSAMASGAEATGPFPRTEPHIVLFSSGTTGRPKGIMLSHRNVLSYAFQQTVIWPRYRRSMRLLLVAAMFNTGGINEIVIATFAVGGTVCILPSRGWSPERMVGYIQKWRITHTTVFPTMFVPILEADEKDPVDFGTLEVVITGGENCPAATMARWMDRWPDIDLCIGYGLTEGGLISYITNEEIRRHPGSVGRITPGQAVLIADPERRPMPRGQIGEIFTASDSVTLGYWNESALTAETVVEGWLKTGDLGRIDSDGYLYIEGRSRDMIISKNQNVFPAEIEAVLAAHPAILASAVLGVPDKEYGEAVCAVIVVAPGRELTFEEVVAHVAGAIASYKKPRYVLFRDSLPVGASNKVEKRVLAPLIADDIAAIQRQREAASHGKAD